MKLVNPPGVLPRVLERDLCVKIITEEDIAFWIEDLPSIQLKEFFLVLYLILVFFFFLLALSSDWDHTWISPSRGKQR